VSVCLSVSVSHLRMHIQHIAEPCGFHPLQVPPVMLQLISEGLISCRVVYSVPGIVAFSCLM
jgi:hypothetical protein